MTRKQSTLLFLLLLIFSSALAENSFFDPWVFLGADDPQLNGLCSSQGYLFATTAEGLHFYHQQTGQWTDRTWPGWIGRGKFAAVLGQNHEQRLVTGGVNAWFKGTLFFSDDMGETESLVIEANGGQVTDLAAATFGQPALYACTWSDIVDGELMCSLDDGESWSLITGHGHHAMTDLAVLGHQEVFLAGDNYVAHTLDGGETWENLQKNLPYGQGIYCLLAQAGLSGLPNPGKTITDAAILLASNDSGLYHFDFDSGLWQMVLPTSCRAIGQRSRQIGEFNFLTETYVVTWDGEVLLCRNMDWDNWLDVTGELSPGTPLDVEVTDWGVFVAMHGGGVYKSEGWTPVSAIPGLDSHLALRAFPNPFNPTTTIGFEVPTAGHVLLQVFDLRGALVETLLDGDLDAGPHFQNWRPEGLGSGVYRTMLQIGEHTVAGSVVLLK